MVLVLYLDVRPKPREATGGLFRGGCAWVCDAAIKGACHLPYGCEAWLEYSGLKEGGRHLLLC